MFQPENRKRAKKLLKRWKQEPPKEIVRITCDLEAEKLESVFDVDKTAVISRLKKSAARLFKML